jgi:hypothetical protein
MTIAVPVRKRSSKVALSLDPTEIELGIEDFVTKLKSDDWQQRYDALGNVLEHISKQKVDRFKFRPVFDLIAQRCSDGNSKVSLRALNSLQELVPIVGVLLLNTRLILSQHCPF